MFEAGVACRRYQPLRVEKKGGRVKEDEEVRPLTALPPLQEGHLLLLSLKEGTSIRPVPLLKVVLSANFSALTRLFYTKPLCLFKDPSNFLCWLCLFFWQKQGFLHQINFWHKSARAQILLLYHLKPAYSKHTVGNTCTHTHTHTYTPDAVLLCILIYCCIESFFFYLFKF